MWSRLLSQHEKSSAESILLIQQQFFDYKYIEGNSILQHISAIESLASKLRDFGKLVDEQIIAKILTTLPPSYRHFISAWDSVPPAERTLTSLTNRLLKEETLNNLHGDVTETNVAFFARQSTSSQRNSVTHDCITPKKGKWSNYVCEYCKKIGHSDKVCRKNKRDEEIATAVASALSNRSAGF